MKLSKFGVLSPVRAFAWGLLALTAACGSATGEPTDATTATHDAVAVDSTNPIPTWVGRIQYPKGNDAWAVCTGSLVAPRVILSAAHCMQESTKPGPATTFTLPGVKNQARHVIAYERFKDDSDPSSVVNNGTLATDPHSIDVTKHDIAIGILDHPIVLDGGKYPELSTSSEVGTTAYLVGREFPDGLDTPLRASPLAELREGGPLWYRSYVGNKDAALAGAYSQGGDSGGPWIARGTNRIVALARGYESLEQDPIADLQYRLDASADWLADRTQAYESGVPKAK